MKILRKLYKSPNFWPLLIVIAAAVLAGRSLIFEKGYFNMHDDLQMMRQLEMEKCFLDGQIPCRWVPDMGYGYGFPLFNFYPPLPYLVGQIFRVLQFSFVDTAKLTFALSFVMSGVTMYLLAKEFFGKIGGVLAAIFYVWAPYHAVDIYVRGAMNEAWALIWFPLILLMSYKLIKSDPRSKKSRAGLIISLSLAWAGLLLSHNLMVMIFTPVFAGWCFIFWIKDRKIDILIDLIKSGLLALGLAAFFTLPAIIEQKLVHVDTLVQGYYEYIAHFATIGQLLTSRYWGYGASVWGPEDKMPFPVGQIHWILSIVLIALILFRFIKKQKLKVKQEVLWVTLFAISFGWFAAFMAHQNSTFIWQLIKPLSFVQFPWRFLTLSILGFSFAAGAVAILLPTKIAKISTVILVLGVIIYNWTNFEPQGGRMGPLTDDEKFNGAAWDLQRTAGIFDYLPKSAKFNPKDPPIGVAQIMEGKGKIESVYRGTNWIKFNVQAERGLTLRVSQYDFPNWQVELDGTALTAFVPKDEDFGRLFLHIPEGNHAIYMKLTDTPIRKISNAISLATWGGLLVFLLKKKSNIRS